MLLLWKWKWSFRLDGLREILTTTTEPPQLSSDALLRVTFIIKHLELVSLEATIWNGLQHLTYDESM